MKESATWLWERTVIFFISFLCICLELFATRILNLKTFNHVVYVIIPFAILGYGIGANLFLIQSRKSIFPNTRWLISLGLILLAILCVVSTLLIIQMPLSVKLLENFFLNLSNGFVLCFAYLIFMLPFVVIGYLVLFIFSSYPGKSGELYFWDLLGAGCGAIGFFFLIGHLQVLRSIVFLALASIILAISAWLPRSKQWLNLIFIGIALLIANIVPEISNYATDNKGWENFPKFYEKKDFEVITSHWHPLGRTDTYHLINKQSQEARYMSSEGTFQVNVLPPPDFTYFSTNFLGGTPVYKLSDEGIKEYSSKVLLFSQPMEFPYIFLHQPDVLVIGAGGGRDIAHAKSHGANSILGAEINPEIFHQMSKGGRFYEYSGQVYQQPNIKVENIDGRNLVKKLAPNSYDLIVLNGVDTYYGLSTGAYTYAESYLYTKEAIKDYFRVLKDNGFVNFNRWLTLNSPRETLRLFVIIMEGLKEYGIQEPWKYVVVGHNNGWGMVLVKKTPFTAQEYGLIKLYFDSHKSDFIYPSSVSGKTVGQTNDFDMYARAFRAGNAAQFIQNYTFDISAITDDKPFFYKYYRLKNFRPTRVSTFSNYGSGFLIFLIQGLVLFHAIVFCVIFIGLPLFILKKEELKVLPSLPSFVTYFACLGVGYMFIEIPLMQKFSLLLGSPIYAISVTLAALLIFSGTGSYLLSWAQDWVGGRNQLIRGAAVALSILLLLLNVFSAQITDHCVGLPFAIRIFLVTLLIAPVGLVLGFFFPSGLQIISERVKEAMAWAWGINAGFSVIGSMLSIILAQFYGFKIIIWAAVGLYLLAAVCYERLAKTK
jgi:hypothetical protein